MLHYFRTKRLSRSCMLAAVSAPLFLATCARAQGGPSKPLPSTDALRAACAAMAGKSFAAATVTAANRIEADANTASPGMCQVLATRAPYLDIEVVVPDNWSGRYWQQGGGGFDGRIPSAVMRNPSGTLVGVNRAVSVQGAVYAASNGGNRGKVAGQSAPNVFFDGTEAGKQSLRDYSYAALGTTLYFAKGVIQQFFGRDASFRYFNGCSNGGRNAYIAIQRWPDEFDGAVAGCFGMDIGAQTMEWVDLARLARTPEMPSNAQWNAVYRAAIAACDANDNLADGMIANYAGCKFNPSTQQCGQPGASADPAICLTPAQLATVQRVTGTLTSTTGNTIYSGYGWANWNPAGFGGLGSGYVAMATGDPAWLTLATSATFDVNAHYGPVAAGLQSIGADIDKIAIASFIASGKKLINWHDGADGLLSINDHARNLNTMHATAKSMGLSDPSSGSRFFVVPGTGHGGGQSLTSVDWADAIVKWVESGVAPTQLTYNSRGPGGASKSIPVCQYPMYPRYTDGDVNRAASYSCTAP
ncbi:MAG: tannase/feruloyl esterase family alpha/beta hydrolase [Acidobacteriales bacterium]|nr:tannase/feruloyl esterase family alpha/beta hydrolase [Terriglobales bacterium]